MSKQKKERMAEKQKVYDELKAMYEDLKFPSKFEYVKHSTASDKKNPLWGYFDLPKHQIVIRVHACCYGNYNRNNQNTHGKVTMTVRANWDASSCLTMGIESDDPKELIAKFEEYKAFAENIPETTNWRWYEDRGFIDCDF